MAHLFKVTLKTAGETVLQVVADDPETAKTKVTVAEGQEIVSVEDQGEVVA